jgi:hypothetical protein
MKKHDRSGKNFFSPPSGIDPRKKAPDRDRFYDTPIESGRIRVQKLETVLEAHIPDQDTGVIAEVVGMTDE